MPGLRLLAVLALVVCAFIPAAAGAAVPSHQGAHAHARAAVRHARPRCIRRRGHRPRACRGSHHSSQGGSSAVPGAAGSRSGASSGRTKASTHRSSLPPTTGRSGLSPAGTPSAAPASGAPCADADLTPAANNLAAVAAAAVCLVNQVRGQHGLAPLAPNSQLQVAAARHNNDMIARDYFDHSGPGGDTPQSRIRDSGYLANPSNGYEIGENIAWGTGTDSTPRQIVQAWVNSPEHLANILDAHYVDSGLAVIAQAPPSLSGGDAGAIYTQDFGVLY